MPSVIEAAKAAESVDSIHFVIDDRQSINVMAAWRKMRVKPVDRPLKAKENLQTALDHVWDTFQINYVELAELSKLPLNLTVNVFQRLVKAGMVYPDGAIHSGGISILNAESRAYLNGLVAKPYGKTKAG